jgi:hypothetical protein
MQTDRERSNRFDFDWGREKPSPAARCIFAAVSAATQTRHKFGSGLHRRGLTTKSACVLPYTPGGPLASDSVRFVSCDPHRFRGLHREKATLPPPSLHRHQWRCITGQRRFQLCAVFNGAMETTSSYPLKGDIMAASSSTTSPPHGHHDKALAIPEERCLIVQGQGEGQSAATEEEGEKLAIYVGRDCTGAVRPERLGRPTRRPPSRGLPSQHEKGAGPSGASARRDKIRRRWAILLPDLWDDSAFDIDLEWWDYPAYEPCPRCRSGLLDDTEYDYDTDPHWVPPPPPEEDGEEQEEVVEAPVLPVEQYQPPACRRRRPSDGPSRRASSRSSGTGRASGRSWPPRRSPAMVARPAAVLAHSASTLVPPAVTQAPPAATMLHRLHRQLPSPNLGATSSWSRRLVCLPFR